MIGFATATRGELLYETLVKRFVNGEGNLRNAVGELKGFSVGGRSEQFSEYFTGIFCFNLTARLLKTARVTLDQAELGEALHHGNMLDFLCNQLNISEFRYRRHDVNLLINLSFDAVRSSKQEISARTKQEVIGGLQQICCYICGREVFQQSVNPEDLVQYEHIWPRSYGGDSSALNLLPACHACNNVKDSMLLWQDGPVHSFILPPYPNANDLTTISRRAKITKHRQHIFELAISRRITLKEAALELGPYDFANIHCDDPADAADFFTFHF